MVSGVSVEDVRQVIADGVNIERLETLLDSVPLDPDEKAALWLSAWARPTRAEAAENIPGLYLG